MRSFWLILIFYCAMGNAAAQTIRSSNEIYLNDGWKFREANKTEWFPATVPGCVHTDLLASKMIEDPFYRDNEKSLQWIGKTDWEYQTVFRFRPKCSNAKISKLYSKGLDTYANVFLNDKAILECG